MSRVPNWQACFIAAALVSCGSSFDMSGTYVNTSPIFGLNNVARLEFTGPDMCTEYYGAPDNIVGNIPGTCQLRDGGIQFSTMGTPINFYRIDGNELVLTRNGATVRLTKQ